MVQVFSLRVPQADIYRELNLHIVLSLKPNRVEKRVWKGGRRRALHDSGGKKAMLDVSDLLSPTLTTAHPTTQRRPKAEQNH